jgi:hypothetical protein
VYVLASNMCRPESTGSNNSSRPKSRHVLVPGAVDSGEETGGARGPAEGHEQPSRPSRAPENGPERIQESRHFHAPEDQPKRQGSPSGGGRRDGLK